MKKLFTTLFFFNLINLFIITTTVQSANEDDKSLRLFEDLQNRIISVSDVIKPSVVHVGVVQKIHNQKFETLGSGLIIDEDGYILTNEHVVENAQSVTVTLASKLEYPAEIIGTDKQTDLALLKITSNEKMQVAVLGDSDSCKVGEWVIAVGNPYGFDRTVSFGIISGKGRVLSLPIETQLINDFIQTDAVIDPGSSGGPLVNLRGEVIGINSIGYGRGQGFTIPVNIAKEVRNKLMATGMIERGWIGIITQPLSREYAEYFDDKELQGILISDVIKSSPAEKGGLKQRDVIIALNGKKVSAEKEDDLNAFSQSISSSVIGEEIQMEIVRDGKKRKKNIKIALQPKVKAEEFEDKDLGLTIKEITDSMYRQYALETVDGVFVQYTEVGGPAGKANLEMGDIIVRFEEYEIKNLDDFKSAVEKYISKRMILLQIIRGKNFMYALLDRDLNHKSQKISNDK
ncbi:MAG: PDZ domain-containing protein [candidate division Zixibacteria bacterium]|nr:PDZ domain-containing protein [candidate division Zixibacteria bacterium]